MASASHLSPNDELMDELYDELDKKAYEYMLEQGLISEGEEIYVGIQKSDPVTDLIGNVITFLVAYGLSYAGWKVSNKKNKREKIS